MKVKHTHLYFHGHLPAVLHPGQMNLTYGRRCKRTLLKRLQLVPPVGPQVAVQGFLQSDRQRLLKLLTFNIRDKD